MLSETSLRSRIAFQAFAHQMPLTALVVLTERCHLHCHMCYLVQNPRPEMTTEEIKHVLSQLADMGVIAVTLTGGEPMLRPDVYELIQHARACGLVVTLFTTATSCNPERSKKLAAAGLNCASVSLYSVEASIHDAVTQVPGSFEKTQQGLQHLKDAGVALQIKFLQMTTNSDQLQPTRDLAESLGASFVVSLELTICHDGRREPLALQMQEQAMMEVFRHLAHVDPEGLGKIVPARHRSEKGCGAGRTRLAIGTDGTVYPCLEWPVAIGHVREQTLAEIWQHHAVQDLRKITRYSDPICRVCPDRAFCSFCPGTTFLDTGAPDRPSAMTCMKARTRRLVYEELEAKRQTVAAATATETESSIPGKPDQPEQSSRESESCLHAQKTLRSEQQDKNQASAGGCQQCSGGQGEQALASWFEQPPRFSTPGKKQLDTC